MKCFKGHFIFYDLWLHSALTALPWLTQFKIMTAQLIKNQWKYHVSSSTGVSHRPKQATAKWKHSSSSLSWPKSACTQTHRTMVWMMSPPTCHPQQTCIMWRVQTGLCNQRGGVKLYVWATYHKFFISKYHREIACHVINVDLCVVALNIKNFFTLPTKCISRVDNNCWILCGFLDTIQFTSVRSIFMLVQWHDVTIGTAPTAWLTKKLRVPLLS